MKRYCRRRCETPTLVLRTLAASFLVLLILAAFTPNVTAHGRLVSSDPAAGSALAEMPDSVRLVFNEEIDLGLSDVSLLDAAGEPLETSDAEVDPADPLVLLVDITEPEQVASGVYTIVWRVLSAVDGHVTSGTVPFSVGTGEAPAAGATSEDENRPPWWHVLARWLELAGWVALTGVVAFGAINILLVRSGLSQSERWSLIGRWRNTMFVAFGVALTGMVMGIWAQTLRVSGEESIALPDPDALGDVLAETSYGNGWLVRLLLGAVLLLGAGAFPRLDKRWHWLTFTLISFGGLLTISWTGHANAEPRRTVAIAVDFVHLSCASVWLGGLVALVVGLAAIRGSDRPETASTAAALVRRHSLTSLIAMGVIVTTGILSASFHVGGFRSLRSEDYGVTLLAKVALLIVVLVAAAINLLVLKPRVAIFLRAHDIPGAWKQITSLRYVATFEVVFASFIILASAVLTLVAPADYPLTVQVAARSLTLDERVTAGDLEIRMLAQLTGDPSDRYTFQISSIEGGEVGEIQRVIVETALAGDAAGEEALGDRFDAEPVPGELSTYAFPATRLGLEGEWTLNIVVRRAGVEDVEGAFTVDTTGTSPPAPRLVEDTWNFPEMTLASWGFVLLALVMMIIGLAGLRYLTGLEPIASGVLLAMCVLIAAGFVVSAARQTIPVSAGQELENPMTPDDVSIREGAELYAVNCMVCHGAEGKGVDESVDAAHSHGDAADLTRSRVEDQTDGDLFYWTSQGVPGTEMPAFDEALTDEEIWKLVTYVRELQEE
jgi:copper transport protein